MDNPAKFEKILCRKRYEQCSNQESRETDIKKKVDVKPMQMQIPTRPFFSSPCFLLDFDDDENSFKNT